MLAILTALIAAGGPRAVLSGPEQTTVTADGHVVIHWTTEGADATTPDAVAATEAGLATVWAAFVDDDGWPAPAADAGIGGDDRLDLYLHVIDGNGYAHVETATGSCWMEVDPQVATGVAPVTFASIVGHELHHCLQFAITTTLESWIYEATSTYVQYSMFDGDVALGLARDALWSIRLSGSERAFDDEQGQFEYAGMVWVKYLIDRVGEGRATLLTMWQVMAGAGGWIGGPDVLVGSVEDAASELAAWNVFACDHDDGLHYAADPAACGSSLDVGGATVTELPAGDAGDVLALHGSDYVELVPDLATLDLDVTVTAIGRVEVQLVEVALDGASPIQGDLLDDGATVTFTAADWNDRARVVLVVTARDAGASFTWTAEGHGVYVPPEEPPEAGCGCQAGAQGGWWPLLAALGGLRRRRRGRLPS